MTVSSDEPIYEFSYAPTVKEIKVGSALMSKGLYPGIWLRLCQLHGFVLGLAFAVAGFATSTLLFKAFDVPMRSNLFAYWAIGMILGFGLMLSGRIWHAMSAKAYQSHTVGLNQTMQLSSDGLVVTSELANFSYRWGAFRAIEQSKDMTTLLLGNTGFILPNRLLGEAGDSAEIAKDVRNWFDAAQSREAT